MDKIKLLQERRQQLLNSGKAVRADIDALIDENSFVELSSFSFSESEFYDGRADGEGVVCGFATVCDYPFYVIAQNGAVLNGGISKAGCEKMCKCLEQAEKNGVPVIYLLSSLGVRVGEGVNVLEGLAELLLGATRLKGSVPQYLIVNGEVYGSSSMLAGICDFNFFIDKKSVLAANSPLVISAASGQNLPKEKVGAAEALNKSGLSTFVVKDLAEVKTKIVKINELLNNPVCDCDELNLSVAALNKTQDLKTLLNVFDKDSYIELGANYCTEIKCYLGRIGGISVAAVIFDSEEGVKLCPGKARKLNWFAAVACNYNLSYISFVNTLGIKESTEVANSPVIKELGTYLNIIDCMNTAKISVVYKKAIGLGYTIFAAKSAGYDYTYAFANAKVALFDCAQGAEIELAGGTAENSDKLAERYAEEASDPVNAAKGGYIDNIIEPSFVRQYLIASLQMLIK